VRYFQISKQPEENKQYRGVGISDATMKRFAEEIEESMAKERRERERLKAVAAGTCPTHSRILLDGMST
jgi:hypothetical protein